MSKEITIDLDRYEELIEIEKIQKIAFKILEILNKEKKSLSGKDLMEILNKNKKI